MTTPAPSPPGRPSKQAAAVLLLDLWQQHVNSPAAQRPLPPPLQKALRNAPFEALALLLERASGEAHERGRLRALLQEQQIAMVGLEQRLAQIAQPPHYLGRVLYSDAAARQAWVATLPNTRACVPVHEDVDPAALQPGVDVVLSADRNCVLRVVPERTAAGLPLGGGRIAAFRTFLDEVPGLPPGDGLRAALAADTHGETLVWVTPSVAARIAGQLAERRHTLRVCVDEYGFAFAICGGRSEDPRAEAGRFRAQLQPVAAAAVVGLAAQRRRIEEVVALVAARGGFVLCEGPTGCGKTHLARYALHLLGQHGEVVALTLRSTPDHRYYGQEESDVEALFHCARALAAQGQLVLLFVDEIDKHFYRGREPGESVHVNSTRATWLAQLGDGEELRGVLVFGTTNKVAAIPDELLNRVTTTLSFRGLERAQALALLDHYLPAAASAAADRPALLDAVVGWTHDGLREAVVAQVRLADQSELDLFGRDLRQVSARFFRDLAQYLGDLAGREGPLSAGRALAVAGARLAEVVQGLGLSARNVAERTFVDFDPRNPAELVRVAAARPAATAAFRYAPTEVADAPAR